MRLWRRTERIRSDQPFKLWLSIVSSTPFVKILPLRYLGYARGGDNTTGGISVGYDVDIVINIECNGIEGERDTGMSMESVVWAITNVEKNVKCSVPTDKANIPNLESIFSVIGRERTARFRKP